MINEYISNLISRMNETSDLKMEAGFDSSKTISWKALREAEKIKAKDYIPELINLISTEKNKKNRDRAYFILGHIAKNTDDQNALNYLISRLEQETDKYIISALLDRISYLYKPTGTNLEPIINATQDKKWLIRYSAIRALDNSKDPLAETALLEVLENSQDSNDLIYANSTLSKIGSLRSIPIIERNIHSKKRDLKLSAEFAIKEIEKRTSQV